MSRYPVLITVAAAICPLLWVAPASAVLVPGLPNQPPAVGFANPLAAVRVTMSGSALAVGAGVPAAANSFSELNTDFADPGDFDTFVNVNKAVNVTSGDVFASAVGAGNAGFGKLGASATALTTMATANGHIDARASVVVEFIDVLQLDPAGTEVVDLNSTWNVDGTITAHAFGDARAKGQVWVFPFGPFPLTNALFEANFYKDLFVQVNSIPSNMILGSLNDLAPGSKYWIYGRLEVFASRVLNGTSIADFSHTAQLFIDPTPGTPAGAYTTASGFDYSTPVPEPAGVALLGIGAISLLGYRRAKSRG